MEAYSLNGINEFLPPVFYICYPILEKKIGIVETYSLNGVNEIPPPLFSTFFIQVCKKIIMVIIIIIIKDRRSGSLSAEGYKYNFAPYCLYFSSGFGKKYIGTLEAYSVNGINEFLPPVFYICYPILEKKNRYCGSVLIERRK